MINTRNVVIRPLLITRDKFLNYLNEAKYSPESIYEYQSMTLPEWLWVVELSVPELYSSKLKVGEVLLNPSFPENHVRTGTEPLLGMRLFDVIEVGNQFNNSKLTKDNKPTSIIVRNQFNNR